MALTVNHAPTQARCDADRAKWHAQTVIRVWSRLKVYRALGWLEGSRSTSCARTGGPMAAKNKCLAQSNKSHTGVPATNSSQIPQQG
jgi:hypothetical protein